MDPAMLQGFLVDPPAKGLASLHLRLGGVPPRLREGLFVRGGALVVLIVLIVVAVLAAILAAIRVVRIKGVSIVVVPKSPPPSPPPSPSRFRSKGVVMPTNRRGGGPNRTRSGGDARNARNGQGGIHSSCSFGGLSLSLSFRTRINPANSNLQSFFSLSPFLFLSCSCWSECPAGRLVVVVPNFTPRSLGPWSMPDSRTTDKRTNFQRVDSYLLVR